MKTTSETTSDAKTLSSESTRLSEDFEDDFELTPNERDPATVNHGRYCELSETDNSPNIYRMDHVCKNIAIGMAPSTEVKLSWLVGLCIDNTSQIEEQEVHLLWSKRSRKSQLICSPDISPTGDISFEEFDQYFTLNWYAQCGFSIEIIAYDIDPVDRQRFDLIISGISFAKLPSKNDKMPPSASARYTLHRRDTSNINRSRHNLTRRGITRFISTGPLLWYGGMLQNTDSSCISQISLSSEIRAIQNAASDKNTYITNETFELDAAAVEANALCDAFDWVKHIDSTEDGLTLRETYVRHETERRICDVQNSRLTSEEAIHIVHSTAAIIGLRLAHELPHLTCVLVGASINTTLDELYTCMERFGEIDKIAIATGNRGFAICRFKSSNSVDAAVEGSFHENFFVQTLHVFKRELSHNASSQEPVFPSFTHSQRDQIYIEAEKRDWAKNQPPEIVTVPGGNDLNLSNDQDTIVHHKSPSKRSKKKSLTTFISSIEKKGKKLAVFASNKNPQKEANDSNHHIVGTNSNSEIYEDPKILINNLKKDQIVILDDEGHKKTDQKRTRISSLPSPLHSIFKGFLKREKSLGDESWDRYVEFALNEKMCVVPLD